MEIDGLPFLKMVIYLLKIVIFHSDLPFLKMGGVSMANC